MYNEIQAQISKRGHNAVNGNIYGLIAVWKSWYRGNVNDFHYYKIKLASGTTKKCERLTMNMGKKIPEDYSKLIWTEKVQIKLGKEKNEKMLWSILDSKKNNFSITFPELIEKAFALGTGAMVEYLDKGEVRIDYLDADVLFPYAWDNASVTSFVALSQFTEKDGKDTEYYTHLTFHEFDGEVYRKSNELFMSNEKNTLGDKIKFSSKFPEVTEYVEYTTTTPHFQFIRPNLANNLDDGPMGISVFANHIDKLKAIDLKYDAFTKEFELGKKRIMVDRSAIKNAINVDTEGNVMNISYFDGDDQVYQAINGMDNQPVKEIDFTLRHNEFIESINAEMNWLSAGVGLGQGYYSFEKGGLKTATEVMSDKSDTFRSKENHQIIIKDAIFDLVKSVMSLAGMGEDTIEVIFDDSIIEDNNAIVERGLRLYGQGAISHYTFLKKYLKFTDEEIAEEIQNKKEENKIVVPSAIDFIGVE